MVCHMHPGTNMVATLPRLHVVGQRDRRRAACTRSSSTKPRARDERDEIAARNPEGAALRGLWTRPDVPRERRDAATRSSSTRSSPTSTATAGSSAPSSSRTARATCSTPTDNVGRRRRSREVREGRPPEGHPPREGHALRRLPLRAGRHGNGKLYGEPRAAVEIDCVDCHGTISAPRHARDVGPAPRRRRHRPLGALRRRSASRRFERRRQRLIQRSMVDRGRASGRSSQVARHRSTPGEPATTTRSRALAKTMQHGRRDLGRRADGRRQRSRTPTTQMTCYTCHTSWMTSCFGCHLPQKANAEEADAPQRGRREPQLDDATTSRCCATTSSCWAVDGTVDEATASRPVRSSSAVLVSSQNAEPRVDLLAAADGLGGGLQRAGVQSALRAAHRARAGDARPAPTATSRRTATTTPGWRSS